MRIVVLLGVICVAVLGLIALRRSSPVLVEFNESGDPLGEPAYVLLNPMRDRSPERKADELLRDLEAGRTSKVSSALGLEDGEAEQFVENEQRHRLRSWSLASRRDEVDGVRLFYRVKRGVPPKSGSFLWMELTKVSSERWEVTKLESWY